MGRKDRQGLLALDFYSFFVNSARFRVLLSRVKQSLIIGGCQHDNSLRSHVILHDVFSHHLRRTTSRLRVEVIRESFKWCRAPENRHREQEHLDHPRRVA